MDNAPSCSKEVCVWLTKQADGEDTEAWTENKGHAMMTSMFEAAYGAEVSLTKTSTWCKGCNVGTNRDDNNNVTTKVEEKLAEDPKAAEEKPTVDPKAVEKLRDGKTSLKGSSVRPCMPLLSASSLLMTWAVVAGSPLL